MACNFTAILLKSRWDGPRTFALLAESSGASSPGDDMRPDC